MSPIMIRMSEYIKATQAEFTLRYNQSQIDETLENWVARQFRTLELPDLRLKKRSHKIDSSPLHWLLWTTEAVDSVIDALDIVRIYMLRWKIEEFFLTLKQGCKIEKLQFETAARLAKTLAFYAPVAARILKCRDLARLSPDAPCTTILSRAEWHALWLKIHKKRPEKDLVPPTIKEAVLWIGRLDGHLNRKSGGMPGVRTLWLGFRDLALMAEMYRLHK